MRRPGKIGLRPGPRGVLAAALALAALAGCGSGGDKPKPSIPADSAATLNRRLDVVENQFKAGGGACEDIKNSTRPVIEQDLAGLPDTVDGDVRSALERSFERLFELVDEQCDAEPTPTQTQETQPETTPPETQTQETETQETQPQTQPDRGRDNGGGGRDNGGGREPGGGGRNDGGGESGDEGGTGFPGGGE